MAADRSFDGEGVKYFMKLFTNTNDKHDFLLNLFEKYGEGCDVYIASAFFTHERMISNLVQRGCRVYLVVRLGYPTSYEALNALLSIQEVQVRFYTSRAYHPKIYILGSQIASVGSSNLTDAGLVSNQEVNVAIPADNPVFSDILDLFSNYWEQARVLDPAIL
ncbi:MAG: phospholipase D family protein [Nitrospirae bacterium]|nr:phospholipase D family protein [Nitrospirota bacterium]